MSLSVAGVGLVSSLGLSPSDHVFFLRAHAARPRLSPYRTAEGEPYPVCYAPWLGARLPVAERLIRLATGALKEAAAPLEADRRAAPLFVCTAAPRAGLPAEARDKVERALAAEVGPPEVVRFTGAAGVFAALVEAAARIERGKAKAALIVAVDSFIDLAALSARAAKASSPWAQVPLSPGEGAAALLVTGLDKAPGGAGGYGVVRGAACVKGTSTDEDDEPVDGKAMGEVLRALPRGPAVRAVYGQLHVDDLRRDEWMFAMTRAAAMFDPSHELVSLEEHTGETGAAAGAMALAFGLAAAAHGTAMDPGASFIAWAISGDGVRGAALASRG